MIESGVNVRVESRVLIDRQLNANNDHGNEIKHGVIIGLEFFYQLFYVFLVCLTASSIIFQIEIVFNFLNK